MDRVLALALGQKDEYSGRRAMDIAPLPRRRARCTPTSCPTRTKEDSLHAHAGGAFELPAAQPGLAQGRRRPAPPQSATDVQFAEALSRCLFEDYERLYRFANDASKKFLIFMTYEAELKLILSALRRLSEGAVEEGTMPAAASSSCPGWTPSGSGRRAASRMSWRARQGASTAPPCASWSWTRTGKPAFNEAALPARGQYYHSLDRLLHTGYDGPAKRELMRTVSFRADMLNISYLLRLRRFGTPRPGGDAAAAAHARCARPGDGAPHPRGGYGRGRARGLRRLQAGQVALRSGGRLAGGTGPRGGTRVLQKKSCGAPNLSVVDAFLQLKEGEARMLRRAFVALQYGLSPAGYMD